MVMLYIVTRKSLLIAAGADAGQEVRFGKRLSAAVAGSNRSGCGRRAGSETLAIPVFLLGFCPVAAGAAAGQEVRLQGGGGGGAQGEVAAGAAAGARGLIVVRGVEVRPRIESKPGFWTATMEGTVLVVASIAVEGPRGRVYGQTFEGQGFAGGDAGVLCSGGSQALADAASQATRDTVRKMAEGFANSDRIRGSES